MIQLSLFSQWQRHLIAVYTLFLLTVPSIATAQPISFSRLTVIDGLSQSSVHTIKKDNLGFLWIGTQDGLNRFDGYQFKKFLSDSRDPTAIPSGYINQIAVDHHDQFWLATEDGVSQFDPEFESSSTYSIDSGLPNNNVRSITLVDNVVWAGTANGLARKQADLFVPLKLGNQFESLFVTDLLADKHKLWISSRRHGLLLLDTQSNKVLLNLNITNGLTSNHTTSLFLDSKKRLWVGTDKGLIVIDTRSNQLSSANLPIIQAVKEQHITSLLIDSQDNQWIGTTKGLWLYQSNSQVVHLTYDPADYRSISADHITCMFEDKSGLVWIGTWSNGFNRYDPRVKLFNELNDFPDISVKQTRGIQSIHQTNEDDIWIGTRDQGAFYFNSATEQLQEITLPVDAAQVQVDGILKDDNQRVWIASSQGLFYLDNPKQTPQLYQLGESGSEPWIRIITQDSTGNIWLGTEADGVFKIDIERVKVTRYHSRAESPMLTINNDKIWDIHIALSGNIWIATWYGLNIIDVKAQSVLHFKKTGGSTNGLSSNQLTALFQSQDDEVWVGTKGGGINRARIRTGDQLNVSFETFDSKNGFDAESVGAILEDNQGDLWVSTNRNLIRINQQLEMRSYEPETGTLKTGYLIGSSLKLRDGRLVFGGFDGLSIFSPKKLVVDTSIPNAVVTSLFINNREVSLSRYDTKSPLSKSINYTEELQLDLTQQSFSFELSALHFVNPGNNRYRYRLLGFNDGWIETDSKRRFAAYTRPPPGRYVFQLVASNADGIWQESPFNMKVHILPPWWRTWWAYLFFCLSLSIIIYLVFRFYHHQVTLRAFKAAALTDPLTSLNNRRFFEGSIEADARQTVRNSSDSKPDSDLAFFMIDIDHFKSVNDQYGHDAGDKVLVQFADILRQDFRSSDYLIRWGGEEFLVVSRFIDAIDAHELAERFRKNVSEKQFSIADEKSINMTVSIGFSKFPLVDVNGRQVSWPETLELADYALYYVKRHGRNGWAGLFGDANYNGCNFESMAQFNLEEKLNNRELKLLFSENSENQFL